MKKWMNVFNILVALSLLLTACGAGVPPTQFEPAPQMAPRPEAQAGTETTSMAVSNTAGTPGQETTPRPDFLPADAVLVPTPVAVPTAPGSQVYGYRGPTPEEMQMRKETQGYIECPEEEIHLLEDGIMIVCPGVGADMPVMAAIFLPAGAIALADTPWPGPADVAAVGYVFVATTAVVLTGVALSQMPRVLMARNPELLPPVTIPEGVPAPPPHIMDPDHRAGAFGTKLKQLGWVAVFTAWTNWTKNGGEPPDWCGVREDGAILVAWFGLEVATFTGRVYKGFAAIINMGGGNHDSTVLIKITQPNSNNSGRDDFGEFTQIDPSQCPPPPVSVAR